MADDPAGAWREHVDLAALSRWMDRQGLGNGPIGDVRPLGGGTQNILLRFTRSDRDYVLRRPPAHPRPESNETMRREARVLAAIAGSGVPHPALIAACAEEEPLGVSFYLMEPVEGVNAGVALPPSHCTPKVQHAMGLAMVDAIATLGTLDPDAVGLAGFGKAEGFLERQVPRWTRQLGSYAGLDGWAGPDALPGRGDIAHWLEERRPPATAAGILHGDYHLSNVLFRPDSPDLAAAIDWELSTIGDPLLDLGWLLATWAGDDGGLPIVPVAPWVGFPKTGELIDHYATRSSRSVDHARWYAVLACYKLGIILEGSHARACAGLAERETGDHLHASAIRLFERALGWIG
ncbi:phosphotransferase family protein [Sphingomonas sp. CGMCC 1.13654]|uniref:Phosphotransferase family protein n=1 Tax=Sphingomonas chungangi TaxID=2683589 RepID=A0A838L566_9SPHN|nr:phosphotransferase family protein [Sphingomonas chungangi]MBA2933835.1 phosphotransferase family protein [Sphingomonas chungangi]MVW55165.1 phosphotransferase [Sphingomonas chungangi]